MGLFGIVWKVVAVAILAVIGLGAYLYFTDYEVSATVVERSSSANDPYVVIQPDAAFLASYRYQAPLEPEIWQIVCQGYNVKFHVKSQIYKVYDASDRLVYDSKTGAVNQQAAVECGLSNNPGGGGLLG